MTNADSAIPSASQPPTTTGVRPSTQEFTSRWDWLRIGIFFWGTVFLIGVVPAVLYNWYFRTLVATTPFLYTYQLPVNLTFGIGDLVLPATLLIAGSTLSGLHFREVNGRARSWAIRRLALALGIIGAVAGFALAFNNRIYHALQSPHATGYAFRADWLVTGIENGLVLGIALAFVYCRLAQRLGRAWLVGLLGTALIAGCALGLYNHLDALLQWIATEMLAYMNNVTAVGGCAADSGGGCLVSVAQGWVVMSALPVLLALLLGALIGAPLAYPYGMRERYAPEAAGRNADAYLQSERAQGKQQFLLALDIGVVSFVAGLLVAAAWLYAELQLILTASAGQNIHTMLVLLAAIELLPFGIIAVIGATRLTGMPRERRPSTRSVRTLSLVTVVGLASIIVPTGYLFRIGAAEAPNALVLGGAISISGSVSLGALLALCWWPATSMGSRHMLTTALSGWLGFALPSLLMAGDAFSHYAPYIRHPVACHTLGCAATVFEQTGLPLASSLMAIFEGLPLILFGVWMGNWLLRRREVDRARDGIA